MRTAPLLAAVAVVLAGCNPIHVTTSVSPDANFASLRTFKVLDVPVRRGGAPTLANDPMVNNSITNRGLREHLANALASRGYARDQANPDFTVAYYASVRGELDVTAYDYGYRGRWGGFREEPGFVGVRPYLEGTVIVDVVDARSHELLWRGRGMSDVSDDPETYSQNLNRSVKEIVNRFPGR